ncbi:MAG: hypothetical protein JNM63_15660 [Spirochaetia bacterium]|nr:hypothetical protein [Spirochaetia bacterium]
MRVEAQVAIQGSKAAIWKVIANIENAAEIINGIEKIEVLEKPSQGLVGMRWRETRLLFDKPATVEKWITDAAENEFYKTKAEDSGFAFLTTFRISENRGAVTLTSAHETTPQGLVAGLKALPMFLFKGVIRKAILKDLEDIKLATEKK